MGPTRLAEARVSKSAHDDVVDFGPLKQTCRFAQDISEQGII